jgi:tetratricopeptide (TPR) repeat protein
MEAENGYNFEEVKMKSLELINSREIDAARELWTAFINYAMQHAEINNSREYAECCIEMLPDFYLGYLASGSVKQFEGNLPAALRDLSIASILNPGCQFTLNLKFSVLNALKRYSEALKCAQQLVALCPENPEHLRNCANVLMAMGDGKQAITFLDRYLELQPDEPAVLIDYALCLGLVDQYDRALSTYKCAETLLRNEPLSSMNMAGLACVHLNRGMAKMKSGNYCHGKDEENHGFAIMELVDTGAFGNRDN